MQMFPSPTNALAAADLCVKCGLCLPHCPTYRLSQHEADGPRGRIALSQALISGALAPSPSLAAHLDACLSCRACEAVCPAKVPYGQVLDAGRLALASPSRTRWTRLLGNLLRAPAARAVLRFGLWLLQWPAQRAARLLPPALRAWPVVPRLRAVAAPTQGEFALFTGCVGDIAEREVLQHTVQLFAAAGVRVAIPQGQDCCGALHQHGGLPTQATACASRNASAFAHAEVILPLGSGCGAALRDLAADSGFAAKVQDLCTVLSNTLDASTATFSALPLKVGLHTACTQAHVFAGAQAQRRLLARIPGITLIDLAPGSGCCGAAGTAFISHGEQARALLAPKLDAAETAGVDVIVSANIGCSLHFLAGLRSRGKPVPVLHPVSLLARQLAATPEV